MPMPPETLKTLQDLEITGAGAATTAGLQPEQEDDNNTQLYEQQQQQQQPQLIGIDGHGPLTTAPHSSAAAAATAAAALQAHPSEQPHSTPFDPPLLNHHFAFDHTGGTLPIDPALLDARFDHPAVSGHGCGGVPGFHPGHQQAHPINHHWAVPQPVSSVDMDNFMVSPTSLPQQQFSSNVSAPLLPGMSSFEPMITTTWSMDGSLPSTSTSRGLTVSSSMSLPSTSTPASSKSPDSPAKLGGAMDVSLANHPGMQQVEDQPSKKRRQTAGGRATAKTSTEKLRSRRNNSSPGFSTPQVPIAPVPIAVAGTGGGNKKNIDKRKGSSSSNSNSNSSKHHEKTKTTTTTTPISKTSSISSISISAGTSGPTQPGPSSTTTTTSPSSSTTGAAAAVVPGQPPDPRARNREAANRCRAKSKVAVAELEATERAMSSEHQHLTQTARHLRDEVLALKNELLVHGRCDDELIQQYLTNSARMVGSGVVGVAAVPVTTTTTTSGGLPGLPLQPPPPQPPSLGGGGGGGAMLSSASPPRVLPAILPSSTSTSSSSSSSGTGAGTITRGRGSVGGRRH